MAVILPWKALKSTGSRTRLPQQGKPQDACTHTMVLLWFLDDEDQCFSNWTTDWFLQGASWRTWARGEVLASYPALRFNGVYQFYTTGFFMDSVTTASSLGNSWLDQPRRMYGGCLLNEPPGDRWQEEAAEQHTSPQKPRTDAQCLLERATTILLVA